MWGVTDNWHWVGGQERCIRQTRNVDSGQSFLHENALLRQECLVVWLAKHLHGEDLPGQNTCGYTSCSQNFTDQGFWAFSGRNSVTIKENELNKLCEDHSLVQQFTSVAHSINHQHAGAKFNTVLHYLGHIKSSLCSILKMNLFFCKQGHY